MTSPAESLCYHSHHRERLFFRTSCKPATMRARAETGRRKRYIGNASELSVRHHGGTHEILRMAVRETVLDRRSSNTRNNGNVAYERRTRRDRQFRGYSALADNQNSLKTKPKYRFFFCPHRRRKYLAVLAIPAKP
jgi:hypothetical protein